MKSILNKNTEAGLGMRAILVNMIKELIEAREKRVERYTKLVLSVDDLNLFFRCVALDKSIIIPKNVEYKDIKTIMGLIIRERIEPRGITTGKGILTMILSEDSGNHVARVINIKELQCINKNG
jgi:hypothetical protein